MKLNSNSASEFRNQRILDLHKKGKTQQIIAQALGCSQAWVSKILTRYREEGEEGLKIKKAKGAESKMTIMEIEQLKELLIEGALQHGFPTENWTRERIAALIKNQFNVVYHPAHVSRIMQKIGFSLQKPQSKSYRQDEQSVKDWKTKELPQIKKSP